jgi:PAS domain S-box-containing protein
MSGAARAAMEAQRRTIGATAGPADVSADAQSAEMLRRVAARAPFGLAFFVACVALATAFEVARFPSRRPWMLGFAAAFLVLAAACHVAVRRWPRGAVYTLLAFVNLMGIGLNAYHVLVAAPVASCLWTLTGLLASAAVVLPWGGGAQAIASLGSLLSYPVHLELGTTDLLSWAAGGTYLLLVVGMGIVGAALQARYLRDDLRLTKRLTEREARLQSYFDLALVGTAILATDSTCSEVNDELCRLLGYSRNELLGRRWGEAVNAVDRGAVAAQIGEAFAGRVEERPRECRLVRRDGRVIDAVVGMRGLPGPGDTIDHVMVLVQDITERKRTEAAREAMLNRELEARQQAEQASRAKDSFLAAVSHELRTPLSPILAWSDLLRRGELDAEQSERALAAIARNASVQSQLIEDLLDVSRVVAGNLRLERAPVDLAAVVREALDVVRPAAQGKEIALESRLEERVAYVSGDAARLRQVFWNLLSNAIKFTPRGGRIAVVLGHDDARARVTVSDSGQGISASFLPHVFEPFRQADPSATRRHGGLGLGLAIVRELVELHGGSVRAESAGPDAGSAFTVELPLALGVQPAEARPSEPPEIGRLEGLRVLVVDDDPDSNESVRALLASRGVDVRLAGSAHQALEVLREWLPDLLVSDIAMPGEDGYTLLARLRAAGSPHRSVPAVALTAFTGREDREQMLSAGFAAHVPKPVRTTELMSAVATAARRDRQPS